MAEALKNTQPTYSPPINSAPVAQVKTVVVKQKTWKLKLIILLLFLAILAILGAGGYLGYKGYEDIKSKRKQILDLTEENTKLNKIQNTSSADLHRQINDLDSQKKTLQDKVANLESELKAANEKIVELTPKDITEFDYKNTISVESEEDGVWLEPVFVDLNGDNKKDGVFAYQMSGTGKYLNLYAYTYVNNEPVEILRAEGYQRGSFELLSDGTIQIKSQSGTPDSPETAITKFKWSAKDRKLVKIS